MTPNKQATVLETLNALSTNPNMSQRSLAQNLGIALGAANANVQYCIRSGFLRKSFTGRTGYQITEKGFDARREITAKTYNNQLELSRNLSEEFRSLVARLSQRGFTSFYIQGINEISDIAFIAAKAMGVEVAGFISANNANTHYLGCPIVEDSKNLLPQQAILFTDIKNAQETFTELSKQAGRRRVAVPLSLQELITVKDLTL